MRGGIFGNYAGSCVACLSGTDTALAFEGQIEWLAAVLMNLGLPREHAIATVRDPNTPMEIIDGSNRYRAVFRVCQKCVGASVFAQYKPVVAHVGASLPIIGQVS